MRGSLSAEELLDKANAIIVHTHETSKRTTQQRDRTLQIQIIQTRNAVRGTQQLVGQQGTIRQQESASSELTQWAFGFGEMGDERKTAKAKATTRHCFMYNESLELTAPQHTAVKT
jgi:hypothetical protein